MPDIRGRHDAMVAAAAAVYRRQPAEQRERDAEEIKTALALLLGVVKRQSPAVRAAFRNTGEWAFFEALTGKVAQQKIMDAVRVHFSEVVAIFEALEELGIG